MSFKLTAVLLALLVILGGGAYAVARSKAKPATEPTKYLYKYPYEDITKIDIDLPDKSMHIKQTKVGEQETWAFADGTGPSDDADTANASNVQLIMSGPAYARVVADGPDATARLADYGLAKPSIVATITTKNGVVHKVLMGDKTPDGKYHYAKNAESDTIYLVDKVWGDELTRVVNNPPLKTATPTA